MKQMTIRKLLFPNFLYVKNMPFARAEINLSLTYVTAGNQEIKGSILALCLREWASQETYREVVKQ